MKKVSFFPLLFVFMAFLLFAANCKSAPPPDIEESPVWGLLRKGDDKARGYFMGEIDIDAVDSTGKTPLHYAAERKDAQLAKFFIDIGTNPNVIDNEGQTPLGICIENNDPQVAAVLASGKIDIHKPIPFYENNSAAILAMEKSYSIFRAILNPATINTFDTTGKSILHIAVSLGNFEAVTEILSIATSPISLINKKDNSDKNSLDYALERADSRIHIAIAEQLILAGGFCENPIFEYFGPAVRSVNYNIRRNEGLATIHYAVMNNHVGLVIFLLEKKIDINIKTTSGATPLHEAVRVGNKDIISMLISYNADVNAKDASGNTPLHVGMPPNDYFDIVSMLLAAGARVNLRDDHGDTPLHIAIILNRSAESVQLLLNAGADVHIRNINGKTPLFIAVQEHRIALIPMLLTYGSEIFAIDNNGTTPFDISSKANDGTFHLLITNETINQRDSQGNTMLHCAVSNRATSDQIARILDHRAPVDSRNREGDTALHIAVRTNQRESGEYLLTRGADIFSLNSAGENPLFLALGTNNLREWIINSRTITEKDGLGNNMLHYAAEWGLNNAISIMIRSGISVDSQNATGQTPLFLATKSENPETIKIFIENNANLNARDSQGNTALHAAVRWNAVNSVLFLLTTGMDINAHSFNGNTPLHDAVILNLPEIEILFIKQKADMESKNVDGNTPLMEAIKYGLLSSIEILVSNGADTSTRNTRGDTPLHIAVGIEKIEIVNMLLKTGASIHARNTRNRTPFQVSLSISPLMTAALLDNNRIYIPDDFGNSVLHIALLEKSSDDIIKVIINKGARINAVDYNGKTPLRLAVDMELWQSAKIIADSGADPFLTAVDNKSPAEIAIAQGEVGIRAIFSGKAINAKDSSGNTILHLAARLGSADTISILFELGANRSIRNISSEIPSDIAVKWNRTEISELLR
jgi:ankyrin repeat protein